MLMDEKLKEIKEQNPWKEITVDSLIRRNGQKYVLSVDDESIKLFNQDVDKSFNIEKAEEFRFHLEIPPEPWQGNPLIAKVIILTLNPGYVDNANRLTALLLEKAGYAKALCEFKNKVLHLEANSLMPEIESNSNDSISVFDSFNMLGDWYWKKMLKELREEYVKKSNLSEKSFYEKIAVVEYCPYTSKSYHPLKKDCKSMEYTKGLIKALTKCPDKLFVVMRGANVWKPVLKGSKAKCFFNNNRCQYLSKKNLNSTNNQGSDNFKSILEHLTNE